MDVVIDEEIAILEVLPFADAIRGDEQINFALGGKLFAAFFGARRERRENAGKVGAYGGQGRFVAPGPGDERGFNAVGRFPPASEFTI